MATIYKICGQAAWRAAESGGAFRGSDALRPPLKWEPSRGGDLFPHLYGPLPLTAVRWTRPLPRAADGRHVFPELEP